MRYTMIIDGNHFLFKTLHVLPRSGGEILGTDTDVEVYIRKLATDLAYQIRAVEGLIDEIVWTLDSRSWRKDFYPQADYKGTRKQDSKLNWDNFSRATGEFKQILASKGVTISQLSGAEGDDLIYAWNTERQAAGRSTLILTGDRDLLQLVDRNESNNAHTIMYSPTHKKLYVPMGHKEWTEIEPSGDFFDVIRSSVTAASQAKKLIDIFAKRDSSLAIEVDPNRVKFTKVLTGDVGDNVSPAYWYTKTSKSGTTRTYGVSENKASQILDDFIKKHGTLNPMFLHSEEHIADLARILVRVINAKHMGLDQIIGNIKINTSLMVLDSRSIPEEILDAMFSHVESCMKSMNTQLSEIASKTKMLAGTKYLADIGSMKMSSSIFKGDDDTDDMSFITDKKNKGKVF
jgi:5'-3' exonuclease